MILTFPLPQQSRKFILGILKSILVGDVHFDELNCKLTGLKVAHLCCYPLLTLLLSSHFPTPHLGSSSIANYTCLYLATRYSCCLSILPSFPCKAMSPTLKLFDNIMSHHCQVSFLSLPFGGYTPARKHIRYPYAKGYNKYK